MNSFEMTVDLTRLQRLDGSPWSPPMWMEPPPRLPKVVQRDSAPPPREVEYEALKPLSYRGKWQEPPSRFPGLAQDAARLTKEGHARLAVAVALSNSGWCIVGEPVATAQVDAERDAAFWARPVQLEATRLGMAGSHVNSSVGEIWSASFLEATRSQFSGGARIVSELTVEERAYLDRQTSSARF